MSTLNNLVKEESDAISTQGKPYHHSKSVFIKSYDSLELLSRWHPS